MGRTLETLPDIQSYTQDELNSSSKTFPAIQRYLGLIKNLKPNKFEDELRLKRHQFWIQCALATALNKKTTRQICEFWSHCASELIIETWKHYGLSEEDDLALFALGKLGAKELNMSSDVDLMIIGHSRNPIQTQKKIRQFREALDASTAFGFALRVDFDLRPDGNWGPLIVSIPQFQDHYWSRGEAWERLALVRMDFVTGNKKIRDEIFELKNKFSFRKFLDFSLMEDLKRLRNQIHQKAFHTHSTGFDLKLGLGGIRDIELFIHSLLVIHGGKTPSVQSLRTDVAAENLARVLPEQADNLKALKGLYWKLRDVENRVQICEDAQTHFVDSSKINSISSPLNWEQLCQLRDNVDKIVSSLLGTVTKIENHLPTGMERQTEWLLQLGYSQEHIQQYWPSIMELSALSHKKDRDEKTRKEFLYLFLENATPLSIDKRLTLALFKDFIKSIRAKSTLYSLILRNEKLLSLLVVLFAKSPSMAQMLISRPELLDGLLYGYFDLSENMEENLEIYFEKKQISEIRASLKFLQNMDPYLLGEQLSSTADSVCLHLKNDVLKEVEDSDFSIFCLGKWGSQSLGFGSDLDFVFVKNGELTVQDQKAAKKFISYLTSSQRGGKIYDVDLRLRPSGNSGPLLISKSNLETYLREKSQAWERQSYIRCRPLENTYTFDYQILFEKPLETLDFEELLRIRKKLFAKVSPGQRDLKHSPGGIIDIEFAIQISCLKKGLYSQGGSTPSLLNELSQNCEKWNQEALQISRAYQSLRSLEQVLRLSLNNRETVLNPNSDSFSKAAQLMGSSASGLYSQLCGSMDSTHEKLKKLDPCYRQD